MQFRYYWLIASLENSTPGKMAVYSPFSHSSCEGEESITSPECTKKWRFTWESLLYFIVATECDFTVKKFNII